MTKPESGSTSGITVVANWRDSSHREAGGAEQYCEQVAKRLVDRGHRVVLLSASVEGCPPREIVDGYEKVRGGGKFGVYLHALVWMARNRRHISAVVDSQNGIPFFSPLVVGKRTPAVLLLHHVHQRQFSSYFSPFVARVGRWLEGPASRRVYGRRSVVAVSPSTRAGARRVLKLQGPIYVAPPGFLPGVRPVTSSSAGTSGNGGTAGAPTVRSRQRSEHPTIAAVGRMVPHKRFELAVEAMAVVAASHPDAELHLVGDGPQRQAVEELASKVNARIVFHGAISDMERDDVVGRAWLGVNCSAGEGWGISVIEANYLGLPVVGFDVPGLRDSIRDGDTGWLVPEDGSLALCIVEAVSQLRSQQVADTWSSRTSAWAARTNWDLTADIIDGVLTAERDRLERDNRRRHTDLGTHVHVPDAVVPSGWEPALRRTDRSFVGSRGVSILLQGTDLTDAGKALRRIGLPVDNDSSPDSRIELRVARYADQIHPGGWGDSPRTNSTGILRVVGSDAGS